MQTLLGSRKPKLTNRTLQYMVTYVTFFKLLFCDPGHNILELDIFLVQVQFATSKMKLDI